jgi:hypothetical protein
MTERDDLAVAHGQLAAVAPLLDLVRRRALGPSHRGDHVLPEQPATDERVASQNWHVDFDDKHLLKAFVYLSDVGAGHGPFEYVPGSQPGGPHHSVRPWVPMGYGRVLDEDLAKSVPAETIATFTGPKGTLILCNTSGLHRGGFATAGPRVLATATYCSPASLKALSNRNYESTLESADPIVRYALS